MKVKDLQQSDLKELCSKYLYKEHVCSNCPLFNITTSPKYIDKGITGISSACGVLKSKWRLEKQVLENDAEFDEICDEELEK